MEGLVVALPQVPGPRPGKRGEARRRGRVPMGRGGRGPWSSASREAGRGTCGSPAGLPGAAGSGACWAVFLSSGEPGSLTRQALSQAYCVPRRGLRSASPPCHRDHVPPLWFSLTPAPVRTAFSREGLVNDRGPEQPPGRVPWNSPAQLGDCPIPTAQNQPLGIWGYALALQLHPQPGSMLALGSGPWFCSRRRRGCLARVRGLGCACQADDSRDWTGGPEGPRG